MESLEGLWNYGISTETRSETLGLKKLENIHKLSVRVGEKFPRGMYTVTSEEGEILFSSKETLTEIDVGCGGSTVWGFYMDLLDAAKQEVVSFRRPAPSGLAKLQVRVGGVLVAVLRQKPTFSKPVLWLKDASEQKVLKIKGPIDYKGKCDFDLLTLTKQPIGAITKLLDSKTLDNVEDYRIQFPRDLDVKYKAAVLGACILIDFMCIEKSW